MKLSRNQALTLVHLGRLANYGKQNGIKLFVGPAPTGVVGYYRAIRSLYEKGLISLPEKAGEIEHNKTFSLTDEGQLALDSLRTHPIYSDSTLKKRSYASLQIPISYDLFSIISRWGCENIPDENLTSDGRETQGHITVLYGIHGGQQEKVEKLVTEFGFACAYQLGDVTLFEGDPSFDVVKVEILSEDLKELRKRLIEKIDNTQSYSGYNPHITIAYVKKGSAKDLVGADNPFTSLTEEARTIEFSSEDGLITTLSLVSENFVASLEDVLFARKS